MHCKGSVCAEAHNNRLSSVFLICLFSLCFSLMRDTWKTLFFFWLPHPRCHSEMFFMFVLLCLHLFLSWSLSFCSHSSPPTFLATGNKKKKKKRKTTSPVKPAPCLYPSISLRLLLSQSLSPRLRSTGCLLDLWLCPAEWTEHANVTKQPTRDRTGIWAVMTHASSECDKCIWVKRWSPRRIVPLQCYNMATITTGTLQGREIVSVTASASSCPSQPTQSHI